MGKNKRQKLQSGPQNPKHKRTVKGAHPMRIFKSNALKQTSSKPHIQAQHLLPTIPFISTDRILLVGEGDLSFARSLAEHHNCKHIVATVYEDREQLERKYPHVGQNVQILEENGAKIVYGADAMKNNGKAGLGGVGFGTIDRVFFNFPHVGGKSTDVNRQVRYNQELLISFFKNAIPTLAPSHAESTSSIIVTLFEGEPYALWNVRDLARHSGLQVEKSFKFQASAYPGYKHARTLGVVRRKNEEVGGGWRGEERAARSFVLVRKGEALVTAIYGAGKGKQDDSSVEDEIDAEPNGEGEFGDFDEHENDRDEEDEA